MVALDYGYGSAQAGRRPTGSGALDESSPGATSRRGAETWSGTPPGIRALRHGPGALSRRDGGPGSRRTGSSRRRRTILAGVLPLPPRARRLTWMPSASREGGLAGIGETVLFRTSLEPATHQNEDVGQLGVLSRALTSSSGGGRRVAHRRGRNRLPPPRSRSRCGTSMRPRATAASATTCSRSGDPALRIQTIGYQPGMADNTLTDKRVDTLKQRLRDELVDERGLPADPVRSTASSTPRSNRSPTHRCRSSFRCSSNTRPGTSSGSTDCTATSMTKRATRRPGRPRSHLVLSIQGIRTSRGSASSTSRSSPRPAPGVPARGRSRARWRWRW